MQDNSTDLAYEGKGLSSHPFGTVTKPDGQFIDKIQAQIISTRSVQLLQDLHDLETQEQNITSV